MQKVLEAQSEAAEAQKNADKLAAQLALMVRSPCAHPHPLSVFQSRRADATTRFVFADEDGRGSRGGAGQAEDGAASQDRQPGGGEHSAEREQRNHRSAHVEALWDRLPTATPTVVCVVPSSNEDKQKETCSVTALFLSLPVHRTQLQHQLVHAVSAALKLP